MNLEGTIHSWCFYPEVTRDGKANGVAKSGFKVEAKLCSNVHVRRGKVKMLQTSVTSTQNHQQALSRTVTQSDRMIEIERSAWHYC